MLATRASHLGVEALARGGWCRCRRIGQPRQTCAAKVIALIYPTVLGADSIDDFEVLCAGGRGGCSGATS